MADGRRDAFRLSGVREEGCSRHQREDRRGEVRRKEGRESPERRIHPYSRKRPHHHHHHHHYSYGHTRRHESPPRKRHSPPASPDQRAHHKRRRTTPHSSHLSATECTLEGASQSHSGVRSHVGSEMRREGGERGGAEECDDYCGELTTSLPELYYSIRHGEVSLVNALR